MTINKNTGKRKNSEQRKKESRETGSAQITPLVSAKDIANFLRKNTGFFNEYPELLSELSIPHVQGGVVSLVERQVTILREQNKQTSKQLHELIEIARQNEELARKMHQLGLALMDATIPQDIFAKLYDNLAKNFRADRVAVRIFADPAYISSFIGEEFVGENSKEISLFKTIIKSKLAMCGRMKHQQQAFLFGSEADGIASSVMVPLFGSDWSGILAVGSFDPDRFEPGMGVELLANMAEVLSFTLTPWIHKS